MNIKIWRKKKENQSEILDAFSKSGTPVCTTEWKEEAAQVWEKKKKNEVNRGHTLIEIGEESQVTIGCVHIKRW